MWTRRRASKNPNILLMSLMEAPLTKTKMTHPTIPSTCGVSTTAISCIVGWWRWWCGVWTAVVAAAVMMIARDRTIFTSLNDCNMTPVWVGEKGRKATTLITLQTFPGLLKPDYEERKVKDKRRSRGENGRRHSCG